MTLTKRKFLPLLLVTLTIFVLSSLIVSAGIDNNNIAPGMLGCASSSERANAIYDCHNLWDETTLVLADFWLAVDGVEPVSVYLHLNSSVRIGALNITNGLSGYGSQGINFSTSTDNATWTQIVSDNICITDRCNSTWVNDNGFTPAGEYLLMTIYNRTGFSTGIGLGELGIFLWDGATGAETSDLTVSATNIYNGATLTNLSVTIWNATDSFTNASSTTGVVKFSQVANLTTYNVNVSSNFSGGYFNITTTKAIVLSTVLAVEMWQSQIVIDAQTLTGNTSINTFTVTTGVTNNNSNAVGQLILQTDVSTISFNGGASGYINQTFGLTTLPLTTHYYTLYMGTGLFNVSAKEFFTNQQINSFTIQIFNTTSGLDVTNTTANGLSQLVLENGLFTGIASAPNYATTEFTFDFATTKNFSVVMPPNNSILVRIFDAQTGLLIDTQDMSVDLISPTIPLTINFTTGNGTIFERFLVPTTYEVAIESVGDDYPRRNFIATLNTGSHVALNAYMLNDTQGQSVEFFVKNPSDTLVEGATLLVQRQLNDSFVTVAQDVTDFTGGVSFYLDDDITYTITVVAPTFNNKVVTVQPKTPFSYIIFLTTTATIDFTTFFGLIDYSMIPTSGTLAPGLHNFSFITVSPTSIISSFGVTTYFNNTLYTNTILASPGGGTAFITVNTTDNFGDVVHVTYFIEADGFGLFQFNESFRIGTPTGDIGTLDYAVSLTLDEYVGDTGDFVQILIISFIAGAFILVLSKMGFSGLASGLGGIMVFLIGGVFTFLDPFMTAFIVLGAIITYVGFGKGGGET